MKNSRKRILRQIGRGIKEAEFNRLKQDAPKIARTELPVMSLWSGRIFPVEFLDKAKEEILLDIARAIYHNNFVKWQIVDDGDPTQRREVSITGKLLVVKPEGQ